MHREIKPERSAYHERFILSRKAGTGSSRGEHRVRHRSGDSILAGELLRTCRCSAHEKMSLRLVKFRQLPNAAVEGRQVPAYCLQLPLEARYAGEIRGDRRQLGVVDVVREPGVEGRMAAPLRSQRYVGFAQGFQCLAPP